MATIAETKAALANHDRILAVLPTGAGKSTVFSRFVQICVRNRKRVLFFVHSRELVEQFAQRLMVQFEIPSGIILSGKPTNKKRAVQVASVQTLVRRELPPADVIIIDEAHRAKANTYTRILEKYQTAKVIGLTATPFRTDGKPLGDVFQKIIHPVKIGELIKMGFLVGTKVYTPKVSVDTSGIKTRQGDFDTSQLAERFMQDAVFTGVVENYKKHADGMKMVCFSINVKHSKTTCDVFNAAGIPSVHLDGKTPKNEREAAIRAFKAGKVKVLHNVNLFIEGFDVPDTDGVILNRATKSEMFYVQMVGRGLRPAEGKTHCIVLDHGENTMRHGFVEHYDEAPFSLGEKRETKNRVKKCKAEGCEQGYMRYKGTRDGISMYKCDCCGTEDNSPAARRDGRMQKIIDGQEFQLLEREVLIVDRFERMTWKTIKKGRVPLSQLRILGKVKGYKNAWAAHFASEHGYLDIDPQSPTFYKECYFRMKVAEMEAGTRELTKKLLG